MFSPEANLYRSANKQYPRDIPDDRRISRNCFYRFVAKRHFKLITDGIYEKVRHPQYLGLILVTLGQLFVWPTIPTAIMWPILTALYYLQAKREEGILLAGFGKEFTEYAGKTPMFIPRIGLPKGLQGTWK